MNQFLKTAILGIGLAVAGTSAADYAPSAEVRERLEPILTRSGGHVSYFQGPSGMIGIGVTMRNGQQMVFYATPDGETVFSGVAVDARTGENRTRSDMERLPPPDYEPIFRQVEDALEKRGAGGAGEGMVAATEGSRGADNVFYVFIDPKCPFCHSIKQAFDQVMAQGHELTVHYIPIGILGQASRSIANAMAASKTETAMRMFMAAANPNFSVDNQELVASGAARAGANLAMFRGLGFEAVPVVISRAAGEFTARAGGMSAEMIEQKIAGSELAVAEGRR